MEFKPRMFLKFFLNFCDFEPQYSYKLYFIKKSLLFYSYVTDTYFNKEDEGAFLCYNRPDGKYSLPDSFRYLTCKSGAATTYECDDGEIFVPTCKKCLAQIHAQRGNTKLYTTRGGRRRLEGGIFGATP